MSGKGEVTLRGEWEGGGMEGEGWGEVQIKGYSYRGQTKAWTISLQECPSFHCKGGDIGSGMSEDGECEERGGEKGGGWVGEGEKAIQEGEGDRLVGGSLLMSPCSPPVLRVWLQCGSG